MPSNLIILLTVLTILAFCLHDSGVYAFGAGNIPSYAYMEGRAFRHGDIEDVLADIAKKAGGGIMGALALKSKFGGLDIKRIYFGNWLRDYSQAVDIASLKKLQLQTIINLCMALGFLAHGYATHEFEVTEERLGVYLPTEHIDNPKGYGEGEDARKYHPKLRGPVDPRELEIDHRTGMKNYIANENGNWDTSKALVRRTLERCIHLGRQHRSSGQKQDLYEAYRLLGQALHTLEDFSAHSNFCELLLVSMGHNNVFVHVGDRVKVNAPNGKSVAPLVTGTFGSSDFIHSLLGEATDHISEASVSDLNRELEKAQSRERSGPGSRDGGFSSSAIRDIFSKLPLGEDGATMTRGLENCERIRAGTAAGGKRPEDMSPQELHAVLWQVLTFRDSVAKKIEKTIEKIPGLGPMIEKLMDSISVFVLTTLEPYLKPILKSASTGLMSASGEVINNHDQYEVFNDPSASDPTHSFLSKDHFNLILNEPAGKIAMVVVSYAVKLIVKAWSDNSVNAGHIIEDILQCLFHPDFHNSNSQVQREMIQCMREWVQSLGHKQQSIISRLSKENVREHRNIRGKGEGGVSEAEGSAAWNAAHTAQSQIGGYLSGIPGVSQAQSLFNQAGNSHPNNSPFPFRDGVSTSSYTHTQTGPMHSSISSSSNVVTASYSSSSGEASGYYGTSAPSGNPPSQYQYSQGPGYPGPSSYNAPPGPPPGPPSFPGFLGAEPQSQQGYAPSYNPPPVPPPFGDTPGGFSMPGSGPPAFPGSGGPAFPDHNNYASGESYYNPPGGGFPHPQGPPRGW